LPTFNGKNSHLTQLAVSRYNIGADSLTTGAAKITTTTGAAQVTSSTGAGHMKVKFTPALAQDQKVLLKRQHFQNGKCFFDNIFILTTFSI